MVIAAAIMAPLAGVKLDPAARSTDAAADATDGDPAGAEVVDPEWLRELELLEDDELVDAFLTAAADAAKSTVSTARLSSSRVEASRRRRSWQVVDYLEDARDRALTGTIHEQEAAARDVVEGAAAFALDNWDIFARAPHRERRSPHRTQRVVALVAVVSAMIAAPLIPTEWKGVLLLELPLLLAALGLVLDLQPRVSTALNKAAQALGKAN